MKFLLDENVPTSVKRFIESKTCQVSFIRDLIPEGSVDQLVAFVAEDEAAVLVSFDGDFKRIAPRIPDGQKTRFKKLSKIHLKCNEFQSAKRLEKAWEFICAEFKKSEQVHDKRMMLTIGTGFLKTDR